MCLAGGLLGLPAGCAEPPEAVPPPPPPEYVDFDPVGYGLHAALEDTTEHVVRAPDVWTSYERDLHPLRPFRPVDFDSQMVLVAAVPAPSSGYSVAFETIEKTPSGLVARYVVTTPGDDCLTAPAGVVPFQAVAVPQTDMPVRFEPYEEKVPCTLP